MSIKISATLHYICFVACTLGTILLGIQCVEKYVRDDDVSKTHHRHFHDDNPDSIYPSITMCITNPFLEHELMKHGNGINIASYVNFLQGRYWDDRMIDIDYDNVTVPLESSLILVWQSLHNPHGPEHKYHHVNRSRVPEEFKPTFYVSFRDSERKCLTVDIPYIKHALIFQFAVSLKNSIYPNGVRPNGKNANSSHPGNLLVYFHYPRQRYTSYYTSTSNWNTIKTGMDPYIMLFDIKDVSVVKHRKRPGQACIDDWRNYDQVIMDEVMVEAGCRPPHWKTKKNLTLCSDKQKMDQFGHSLSTTNWQFLTPPCNVIENLQVTYQEMPPVKGIKGKYKNYISLFLINY